MIVMKLCLLDWQMCHTCLFSMTDETDKDEYYGRIIDQFTMITVDSAPADNHESTLGTGTNDLGMIPGLIQPYTLAK